MNKIKILIIDDEPDLITVIKMALESNGYEVITAGSGTEGIKRASESPDLILLDAMMPGMDGYEVISKLKKNNRTKNIPIIQVTGKTNISAIEKSFSLGVRDYISKPLTQAVLFKKIRKILSL